MTVPKLSKPSSGYSGRGYTDLMRTGDTLMSITTALGGIEKPGLVDWHVSQTAAYAVTHVDDLLSRTEEQGMRYLQYFSRRKPKNWDDLEVDVWNAAQYVLDDLSATGNFIHEFIEDDLTGNFPKDPLRDDHYQMVEAYYAWKAQHDIEVIATESTVFGDGFAGTADLFARVDGVTFCIDHKSSRKVHETHIAQLAAISASHFRVEEVPEGTPGAIYHKITPSVGKYHGGQVDSWWVEKPMPDFQAHAVLQIRPLDYADSGEVIDPFCEMHVIPQAQIDAGYDLFRAGLSVRLAQRGLKEAQKEGSDD